MSGAPPPSMALVCIICQFRARTFAGLRRHQNARHRRASGLGFVLGQKRRRESDEDATDAEPATSGDRSGLTPGDDGHADARGSPSAQSDGSVSVASSNVSTGSAAVAADLRALYEMTRTEAPADDAGTTGPRQFNYMAVSTHIRALYEELQDV